jgi:MazG family protein
VPDTSTSVKSSGFDDLLSTMARLRNPQGGCPWDLEQTHGSLQHTLLEECYEAMEALASADPADMVEELGDLLIQVVFHAQIGADEGSFTIADVVRGANDKLRRRHPHVFGDAHVDTSDEVKQQWDAIKSDERRAKGQGERSPLDGVPKSMPALAYAQAVQGRVARAGIGPQEPSAPAIADRMARLENSSPGGREREFGELLFAIVDEARREGVEAEEALREANGRFYEWFVGLETNGGSA